MIRVTSESIVQIMNDVIKPFRYPLLLKCFDDLKPRIKNRIRTTI